MNFSFKIKHFGYNPQRRAREYMPGYRAHWIVIIKPSGPVDIDDALLIWCEEHFTGTYEPIFRFNSGNPYIFLRINKKSDAMLFKLTWC